MIFVLEDDPSIRKLVTYTLNSQGLESQGFACPADFWAAMEEGLPSLVLLDIMLPQEDGLHILGRLRSRADTRKLPVIMLTAKGTEYDKVLGLDSGADDYISKPFGMMELVARVKAALRHAQPDGADGCLQAGPLRVDTKRHLVQVDGGEITLTRKEFQMLCMLLEHRGSVFTRDQLLSSVWGYGFDGESRTVDVHIRTLRQKLGSAGALIETVRGIGYRLRKDDL